MGFVLTFLWGAAACTRPPPTSPCTRNSPPGSTTTIRPPSSAVPSQSSTCPRARLEKLKGERNDNFLLLILFVVVVVVELSWRSWQLSRGSFPCGSSASCRFETLWGVWAFQAERAILQHAVAQRWKPYSLQTMCWILVE